MMEVIKFLLDLSFLRFFLKIFRIFLIIIEIRNMLKAETNYELLYIYLSVEVVK